jgi:hypothetical protein
MLAFIHKVAPHIGDDVVRAVLHRGTSAAQLKRACAAFSGVILEERDDRNAHALHAEPLTSESLAKIARARFIHSDYPLEHLFLRGDRLRGRGLRAGNLAREMRKEVMYGSDILTWMRVQQAVPITLEEAFTSVGCMPREMLDSGFLFPVKVEWQVGHPYPTDQHLIIKKGYQSRKDVTAELRYYSAATRLPADIFIAGAID